MYNTNSLSYKDRFNVSMKNDFKVVRSLVATAFSKTASRCLFLYLEKCLKP